MNLNEAFPSDFLKVSDLNGQSVTVEIAKVELTELGKGKDKETKLLISFRGKEKKLVCNKTNAGTISKLYGDETDGWVGQKVTLQPREVEFQGNMVWAIRVSLTKPATESEIRKSLAKPVLTSSPKQVVKAVVGPQPATEDEPHDEVPF